MGILDELKKSLTAAVDRNPKPVSESINRDLTDRNPAPLSESTTPVAQRLNTTPKKQQNEQLLALNNAINKWASQGTKVRNMSSRRKLMTEPEPEKNWYAGETPTNSEILARIYKISETDPYQSRQLFNQYQQFANDPTSPLYNPYNSSTNKAITELEKLGFDMSGGVTQKWINDNAWLMQYYRTETGNTPLSPSSKSSAEQNAAYWYYKILTAEETTQKAETEWQALQDEITYWANRTDRNYTDDEILSKIDWSKYKTLTGMDEGKSVGVPTVLNRGVGYTQDALKGIIWAARNGSTGDYTMDSVNSLLGHGKTWQKDSTIAQKLDPTSPKYSPYSVGSTLDDAALYFGVQDFNKNWVNANRGLINSSDATERKMYAKVYNAEQTTLKAEEELKALREDIELYLSTNTSPDIILDGLLDDYPTLKKMDDSRKSGNLMETTRAIDYRYEDIAKEVRDRWNKQNGQSSSPEFIESLSKMFGNTFHSLTNSTALHNARNKTLQSIGKIISLYGSAVEKGILAAGADYGTNVEQINSTMRAPVQDTQTAYNNAAKGTYDYITQNYLNAYGAVHDYEEAQKQYEDIMKQIEALQNGFEYRGNIDIYNRTPVVNDDGSYSTVDSFSVNIDGKEVLLPTIVDGKRVSEEEAIDHYFKTGEHLGIFDTPEEADEYAQKLHEQQERYYEFPEDSFASTHPLDKGYSLAGAGASDAGLGKKKPGTPSQGFDSWYKDNIDRIQSLQNEWELEYEGLSEEELDKALTDRAKELWREETGGVENQQVYDDVVIPRNGAPAAANPEDQERLNELYAQAQLLQEKMEQLQEQHDNGLNVLQQARDDVAMTKAVAEKYGISDTMDFDALINDYEIAWQIGSEYMPTPWTAYSAYDLAQKNAESKEEYDKINESARLGRIECLGLIDKIDGLLNRLGVGSESESQLLSDEFVDNIMRYRAYLEREANTATYWLLPEEEWFDAAVQRELDRIGDGSKLSWWGLSPLESYVQLAALSRKYPDMNVAALANAYIGDEAAGIGAMTDREKDTLIAIYSEKGTEAAQQYLDFMNDPTYGMLVVRESQDKQQQIAEWTNSNIAAGIGMNILDIIASPLRLMGTAYSAIAGISNDEINPYSPMFAASALDSAVMTTSKEAINKAFGDHTNWAWFANLLYDSGKSIAESMYTGYLFGGVGANLTEGVAKSWLSALPMGAEAVASAVQDAKQRGATDEQALAIGGVTLFAETASEAITMGNLQKAFGKGATGGADDFLKELLKDAFGEEAVGEMFNEAFETAFDYWIMGDKSNYNAAVDRIMKEQGVPIDVARKQALAGVLGDVMYAGLSGALGGIMGGSAEYGKGYVQGKVAEIRYQHARKNAINVMANTLGVTYEQAETLFDAIEDSKGDVASQATTETESTEEPVNQGHAPIEGTEFTPTAVEETEQQATEVQPEAQTEVTEEPVNQGHEPIPGTEFTPTSVEETEAQPESTEGGVNLQPVDTSKFGPVGGKNAENTQAETETLEPIELDEDLADFANEDFEGLEFDEEPISFEDVSSSSEQEFTKEEYAFNIYNVIQSAIANGNIQNITSSIAASLTPFEGGDERANYLAKAAAKALAMQYGAEKAATVIQNLISNATFGALSAGLDEIQMSIIDVALNDSSPAAILFARLANGEHSISLKTGFLMSAMQDALDNAHSPIFSVAAAEEAMSEIESDILADGALNSLQDIQKQINASDERMQDLMEKAVEANAKRLERLEALQTATEKFNDNPNLYHNEFDKAVADYNAAVNEAANAWGAYKLEAKKKSALKEQMKTAAEQAIADVHQQVAEVEAQQAEVQAQQEEEENQQKAEKAMEDFNSAVNFYKPTVPVSQPVYTSTDKSQYGEARDVTIIGAHSIKHGTLYLMDSSGKVYASDMLNLSEQMVSDLMQEAVAGGEKVTSKKTPTYTFQASITAVNASTGEVVEVLGLMDDPADYPVLMATNGKTYKYSDLLYDHENGLYMGDYINEVYDALLPVMPSHSIAGNVQDTSNDNNTSLPDDILLEEGMPETPQTPEYLSQKDINKNLKDSEHMQLEDWMDPRYHGKVRKPKKARTDTKAFKKWFNDPSGDLSNPDGTPKIFYRGIGGNLSSTLHMKHESKKNEAYGYSVNFYMDLLSTAQSYAPGGEMFKLYNITNWETAQAAMEDLGFSLEPTVHNGAHAYKLSFPDDPFGVKTRYFYEDQLAQFNETYGGEPKSKGIFYGYISAKNPLVIEANGANYSNVYATVKDASGKSYTDSMKTRRWAEWAFENGYDAVIFRNVRDNVTGGGEAGTEVVTSQPNMFKSIFNTGKFSSAEDIRFSKKAPSDGTFKLTGQPVSKEMRDVITRLEKGEDITREDLAKVPEVQWAVSQMMKDEPYVHWREGGYTKEEMEKLVPPERFEVQQRIIDMLTDLGSWNPLDNNGKGAYTGEVARNKRLDVVIGPPAAGKSSALANPLSEAYKSKIIDSDMAKEQLPEYKGGLNSGPIHQESRYIQTQVVEETIMRGENVVLPIVGHNANSARKSIAPFAEEGYEVHIHYVELPGYKSLARGLRRFITDGRYIDPGYIYDVAMNDKIENVYQELKGEYDGYSKWSNDVEYGQSPRFYEASDGNLAQHLFGRRADAESGTNAGGNSSETSGKSKGKSGEALSKGSANNSASSLFKNTEGTVKSGYDVINEIANTLGMINDPKYSHYKRSKRKNTEGYTAQKGITHTIEYQDVATAIHEFGHNLDVRLGMQSWGDVDAIKDAYNAKFGPGFLGQYKDSEVNDEVMAEFFKVWMADRQAAVDIAGDDFVNRFENELSKNGWLKDLQREAVDARRWINATSTEKVRAMWRADVEKKRGRPSLKKARTSVADYTIPLVDLAAEMTSVRGRYESKDARALLLDRANTARNQLAYLMADNLVDPHGDKVLKADGTEYGSFDSILNKVGEKREGDFIDLWLAYLDQERAPYNKRLLPDDVDSQAVIDEIEKANPDLKGILEEAVDWYDQFIKTWLVDTGMMPQQTYDTMRGMYRHYIPLHSIESTGSSVKSKKSESLGFKRAFKSDEIKQNPLTALYDQMGKYVMQVKTVEALRAFVHEMEFARTMNLNSALIAEPAQKDLTLDDHTRATQAAREAVLETIMNLHTTGEITDSGAFDVFNTLMNLENFDYIMGKTASGDDVINVPMEDGTISSWRVYDTSVMRALTMMPEGKRDVAMRAFAGLTGFLCSMATGRNIKFALQNIISDSETAASTGWTEANGGKAARYAKNVAMGILPVFAARQVMGGLDLLRNKIAESVIGENLHMETSEAYKLFKQFGTLGGSRYSVRKSKSQKALRREMLGHKTNAVDVAKAIAMAPITTVEALSGFLEETTRFTAFSKGGHNLETYEGRLRAGRDSRESSVDFTKYGAGSDSATIAVAKVAVPFIQAQLSGLEKTASMFTKANKGNRAVMAARLAVNTLFTSALMAAIRRIVWNDDDREAYEQLSPYERVKYWHIKTGDGKFVRLKRSQDIGIQAADIVGEIIGNLITGYEDDPLGNFVDCAREIVAQASISTDTSLAALYDAANNKTWYNALIDNSRMQKRSETARYTDETSTPARIMSYMSGGALSPTGWDYVFSQYLGSLGQMGSGTLDAINEATGVGDFNWGFIIDLIGDQVQKGFLVDSVTSNNLSTVYYDGKGKIENIITEAKDRMSPEFFRYDLTQDEVNSAYKEAEALMAKGGAIYDANDRITALWEEYDKVTENKNLTDEQREEAQRDIRKKINKEYLLANTAIADYMQKYCYADVVTQNVMNALNVFTDNKAEPSVPINNLHDAIDSGDYATANASIQELLDMGKDKSWIKTQVTTRWKPYYKEAVKAGTPEGNKRANEIVAMLTKLTGIKYDKKDIEKWATEK